MNPRLTARTGGTYFAHKELPCKPKRLGAPRRQRVNAHPAPLPAVAVLREGALGDGPQGAELELGRDPRLDPRPKLTPMTGGYRRTPILQIGADFYCDTLLILAVLEKQGNAGTLYPSPQAGLARAFGWWIEKGSFMNAVCLTLGNLGGKLPQELIDERHPFFGVSIEPADLQDQARHLSAAIQCAHRVAGGSARRRSQLHPRHEAVGGGLVGLPPDLVRAPERWPRDHGAAVVLERRRPLVRPRRGDRPRQADRHDARAGDRGGSRRQAAAIWTTGRPKRKTSGCGGATGSA